MTKLHPNAGRLAGLRFGMLTVIEAAERHAPGKMLWRCRCDCGNQCLTQAGNLVSGNSKSCGCQKYAGRYKHGHAVRDGISREYCAWKSMRSRCFTKSNARYRLYGGRGITVCKRWMDFSSFFADMGPCPDGATLDRIDNDGNYEPGNVRWADAATQANNTSRNRKLTLNGETLSLAQWAMRLGCSTGALCNRLRRGWSEEDTLCKPVFSDPSNAANRRRDNILIQHAGKTMTAPQWSKLVGLSAGLILDRIRRGWSAERALSEPVGRNGQPRILEHQGERLTVSQWAKKLGWKRHVIQNRLNWGWPIGRVLSEPAKRTA